MTRYGEGPAVEVETHVDAPVDVVWSLVRDVSLPGRFSDEFRGAEWLDGASEPAVGARFLGRNAHPDIGEWTTVSTVVELVERRRIAWAVEDPENPASVWRFELEEDGGGTRLRQWARLGPGPSGLSYEISLRPADEERIVARRLDEHRTNMLRTLRGIKELAEALAAG